jgi:hypothetical protein
MSRTRTLPAVLLAVVVLVALAGTATAAKLITGKQIKNNTVTTEDLKDGTIKPRDLNSKARVTKTTLTFTDGNDAQVGACDDTALDECPTIIAAELPKGSYLITATGTYANPVNAGVPTSINRCGLWRDGIALAEARMALAGNGSAGETHSFSLQTAVTAVVGDKPVELRCTEFVGEALVITSPTISALKVASIN